MSNLKKILAKNKITQRELAKAVGLSYQTICMYATGKPDMSARKLYRIAKYLDVPMEELIEEENECKML